MRINSIVPNFSADTTEGPIDFYEWQGDSWVVLFSHPADFTPVCTTELGRLAVHQPHFESRNTKLLAHSVDQLQDHVDWVNDIKSYCRDIPGAFPYPIIADHDRTLAVKLDMIDEDGKDDPEKAMTVRALYIISPDHRLRLSMHYPTSTGRNVDEILRVIDSLQLVDRKPEIATPANWVPGEKVMILPTVKDEEIPKLFPGGVDRVTMPSGKVYVRTTTDY
ncbi:peroxiredoxin-6-like [Hylaeus volcanicus]|uniref:peroxiredoxin-6-like n=1 Tax=Hylaeus volcanicus TaxID=313075 RepID=UPI0023B7B8AF|nr:peroxiredoxin-6-like [Hylaeus volcanicus]XP_053988589.1 peroxiredoxin-6-like [Hylaeus volcanicus]